MYGLINRISKKMVNEVPLVLVTGASGYCASFIIKELLEGGQYRVRGTVRTLENEGKVKPLRELVADAKYPLELVEADLLKEDTWPAAVKGKLCLPCVCVCVVSG